RRLHRPMRRACRRARECRTRRTAAWPGTRENSSGCPVREVVDAIAGAPGAPDHTAPEGPYCPPPDGGRQSTASRPPRFNAIAPRIDATRLNRGPAATTAAFRRAADVI